MGRDRESEREIRHKLPKITEKKHNQTNREIYTKRGTNGIWNNCIREVVQAIVVVWFSRFKWIEMGVMKVARQSPARVID